MCYTCGCNLPYEDHGDPNNITEKDFEKAGQTEASGNVGAKATKENTAELIKREKDKNELDKPAEDYN